MSILHLDFETRSDVNLKKAGLHEYARGKNTSVLCMAWAFDDGPVKSWVQGQYYLPLDVIEHVEGGGEVWAHNAAFEREIWNNKVCPEAPIKNEQLVCTMAMAYAMGLPGTLEKAAAALGVTQQKDMEGSRIMRVLSQPKDIAADGSPIWWEDDRLERLVAYCRQDVEVERAIGHRMLRLSPKEREIWIMDQRINSRGIAVDRRAVQKAIQLVENEKARLDHEMRIITGNQVATCNATQQIKDYLNFFGLDPESIAKAEVTGILEGNVHPKVRQVLELRQMGAKAATAKLEPMLTRSVSSGRIHGAFQYSGAGTRRWAGRGVQLQNLKRPTMEHQTIERLVETIRNGASAAAIEMIYGPPLAVLSDCIRSMLIAAPGHDFIVADFSAIEARVLAWLAGQEDVLNVFRRGDDIYKVAARAIFRTTEVSSDQRQVGKVAILALGYQGGVGAFQQMARGYGIRMAPAFEGLWSVADDEAREKAEDNWKANGEKAEISREEFIASDLTKIAWRKANPQIAEYWYQAERAMTAAIENPGQLTSFGPRGREVHFKTSGSFLWCRMPSGGVNCYPYPEIKKSKTPWGAQKSMPSYMAEDSQSRKWMRFTTYGGSIVENITQSISRDLLAEAMLRLEKSNYPVVAHVHDEIICERAQNEGSLEEMSQIMAHVPAWATGLPLQVAGFRGARYRK